MKESKKILLWGAKSKSRILQHMVHHNGDEISFIYDKYVEAPEFATAAKFSNRHDDLADYITRCTHFIVGIGGEHGYARHIISQQLIKKGLTPISLRSSHTYIDETSEVGWGLQAMPGALLHCFCSIGDACVLNSNSCVDHECVIGNGVHIMGSAAIAGRVRLGDYVTVGTNATILPDITVGSGAFIGAGALVNADVGENQVVVGNPARFLRMNEFKYDFSDFEEAGQDC